MNIDPKTLELIHADIDGELDETGERDIARILERDSAARQLHADLRALCTTLDAVEEVVPPQLIHRTIMNSLPVCGTSPPGFLRQIFAVPPLRYAAVFAAGALITATLIGSDRVSRSAFDDVTGLVGTMAGPAVSGPAEARIVLNENDIAGRVSLYRAGSLLVVDFDVTTRQPIDVIARYSGREVWFNGFAQQHEGGTEVTAEPGSVTLHMSGQARYALYLRHDGRGEGTLNLQFVESGQVVHQAEMTFGGSI